MNYTESDCTLVQRYSYDAWGKRTVEFKDSFVTARGFTGHEHLEDFSLINMNGRIYELLSYSC